jgi:hypothetical protein
MSAKRFNIIRSCVAHGFPLGNCVNTDHEGESWTAQRGNFFSEQTRFTFSAKCKEIIREIMKSENAFLFFRPFDPKSKSGLRYYGRVPDPICFYEVQQKLDNEEYQNPDEFLTDVRQIWRNAKLGFDPSTPTHQAANVLGKKFEILAGPIPHYFTQLEMRSELHRLVELKLYRYRLEQQDPE